MVSGLLGTVMMVVMVLAPPLLLATLENGVVQLARDA